MGDDEMTDIVKSVVGDLFDFCELKDVYIYVCRTKK